MTQSRSPMLGRVRLILWGLVVVVGLGATALYFFRPPERPVGLFGGEFTLATTDGKTFTERDLGGIPTLIHFGHTFCPDVCPTTLVEVRGWQEELKLTPDRLRFIMVTVDPERDTLQNFRKYLDAFSRNFIGLVGDQTRTEAAKKAFGVFAQKVATNDSVGYLVDHAASFFLLNKDGRFEGTIAYGEDTQSALAKVRRLVGV